MKKILSLFASFALLSFPLIAGAAVLSTPLTVGSTYPALGGSLTVSGNCGTSGSNNTISFALMQNGTTTPLASTNNLSANATGGFSGSINLPSSFPSGSATLVATCTGSGDTIYSPTVTLPAPTSTSVNLGGITPGVGGTANLNGACGASGGAGTVNFSLTSGSSIIQLGSATLSSTGTFTSNNVVLPSNIASGAATITATCSNGQTFSTPVTLNSPAIMNLSVNASPILGSTNAISGTCSGAANGTGNVSIGLMRFGTITPLSTNGGITGTTGGFNSTFTVPANFGSGTATLVVTCPNGNSFTTALNVLDPANLTVPGTGGVFADLGGVAAGETPTGGVAAGNPYNGMNRLLMVILSLLGAVTLAMVIPAPASSTKRHE